MKRTATTLTLLAGFGGGCVSPDGNSGKNSAPMAGGYGTVTRPMTVPGVQGPGGEPVAVAARGAMPGGVQQAGYTAPTAMAASGVQPVGWFGKKDTGGDCGTAAHIPGVFGGKNNGPAFAGGHGGQGMGGGAAPQYPMPNYGILPVPGMGPPGAVAAVGAIVPGQQHGLSNQRTSIRFTGPAGMKVTWQLPGGGFNDEASGLTAPKEYNFMQDQMYRLRLTQVLPNYPGKTFYPTLQIYPANPKTVTFLSHASVPVTFTNEDFDQALAGNLVVKVIYLPDPTFQDFATVAGAEEIVSTRLEPGADPVAEAQRRGSILAVIRMGNIDLENRASPAMNAVPGGGMPGLPPGAVMVPPGGMPPGGGGAMLPPSTSPPGSARVTGPGAPTTAQTGPAPVAPGPVPPAKSSTPTKNATPPAVKPLPAAPVAPGPLPPAVNSGTDTGNTKPTTLPSLPNLLK